MDCKICFKRGMLPSCPFCGRKASTKKSKLNKIKTAAAKERIKLDQQAFNNFKKTQSDGSGVESFDQEIKDVIGDWHGK